MSVLDRVDLYLQWNNKTAGYTNTDEENKLCDKFSTLYTMALAYKEKSEYASSANVTMWRKAYEGILNALDSQGAESKKKSRQLRKMAWEMVESKVDNSIPMAKIQARYKLDMPLVDITENYLKFELDNILTFFVNDRSERATYVDGTIWYKVSWDSLSNTHERSGNVKVEVCTVDQIVPQPGIIDYKDLEYIFEKNEVSISRIYDLYGKLVTPTADISNVDVITCYYLNSDRVVGRFMWVESTRQVLAYDENWQIRKLRTCTKCGEVIPKAESCGKCGNKKFVYKNATTDILDEDLVMVYNPYEAGETDNEDERDKYVDEVFLTKGTEVPFYVVNQLPFVPRPAVSSIASIYGISEVRLGLDMQDAVNKILTKTLDKTLKSGAVITKPRKVKMGDDDETLKIIGVNSVDEAQMIQAKQIMADTQYDIILASLIYESNKSSSGITESYQGKADSSAISGKAKELQAALTADRIGSLRVMKSAAFAGVYELVLKYLLAFSDEPRKFNKTLPDGSEQEMTWNKYMFLDKDKYGNIFYRDDFAFSSDPAATLSQNRLQMWQETVNKYIQGAFGNPADPRVLKLLWNILASLQYPLARVVLAGIKENEQHLPSEIEQMIMQNPQILQQIMAQVQGGEGSGSGGARPNSGPVGNGATHASNVERTNERNRAAAAEAPVSGQTGGGN